MAGQTAYKATLLVANRGEIAVRIILTAKKLGLRTLSIYSPSDALSTHVSIADKAIPLIQNAQDPVEHEEKAYLDGQKIVSICLANAATLLHPGYGFLSENAEFASLVVEAGIAWLGPRPELIHTMGLKHEARTVAVSAGVPVVPGSEGLLLTISDTLEAAERVGYPVIMKPTAGGGGRGMVICKNKGMVQEKFEAAQTTAKNLFATGDLFIEKYFSAARHVEIQVFGNGLGDVVHMGERECSVQRRHQKIIEESPSPCCQQHPGLLQKMCNAAINLCKIIRYNSAGTVEFLVDDATGSFYFLEMNTRIQVEHPVTEAVYPGLDIVKLMIEQGIAEHRDNSSGLDIQQETFDRMRCVEPTAYAIEGRVYAENAFRDFLPSPGLLQFVDLGAGRFHWLRVDSWIISGLSIAPFFDGLLCKIIVTGRSRDEVIDRFGRALDACKIDGPPNNINFLKAIASSDEFRQGRCTTDFLRKFVFRPRVLTVISAGMECTVQDLSRRTTGFGIPHAGPMDVLAFSAANTLVGNSVVMEGLEIVILPDISCELEFSTDTVVAITGKQVRTRVNKTLVKMWSRTIIPPGGRLRMDVDLDIETAHSGFRVYLSIRGGFPSISPYLGSKSTSMGLGGYQGRALIPGDQLNLESKDPSEPDALRRVSLPRSLIPHYSSNWIIHVLPGPQDDDEFFTAEDIATFYSTAWRVSLDSNRLGIRLESTVKFQWARADGGEGGAHPSNILDNGYATGTVNINGDTPVILTNDGPDMGGYASICTVASSDLWKLGQVQPGNTIQFRRVSWKSSRELHSALDNWTSDVISSLQGGQIDHRYNVTPWEMEIVEAYGSSILLRNGRKDARVTYRQAGDSSILIDFGPMVLDLEVRAWIHAFQTKLTTVNPIGIRSLCPCIRSMMCHYDSNLVSQAEFLKSLVTVQNSLPESVTSMTFSGRRITFPIVLDDPWNNEALERYMKTVRPTAVYLPSNIDYLANNNGLNPSEALRRLVQTEWLVFGVGFYLGCPFLVPIDPRCRLVGQKMNPSRKYTPRGAIGLAGSVAAIYPIESPGGYQLFGRTLPAWQTWGKGHDFVSAKPWLLQSFDQIHFEVIHADEYPEIERQFDSGSYKFKIEPTKLSVEDYRKFTRDISRETSEFEECKRRCSTKQAQIERDLLDQWEKAKQASTNLVSQDSEDAEATTINAPMSASILKITCQIGDEIISTGNLLFVLEAMKMEIPIRSTDKDVGKVIKRLGDAVAVGRSVHFGDVLLVLSKRDSAKLAIC